jgi:endoglucanase
MNDRYPALRNSIMTGIFLLLLVGGGFGQDETLKINEHEYFEKPGLNVLVFSNQYTGYFFDEKTAGIELIHHGVRTATGGAVRLNKTPEQWDQIPMVAERNVDKEKNIIEVLLQYKQFEFNSRVVVAAKDKGILISVFLDEPLPKRLEGHTGFNLEFLPSAYFEKTYLIDGKTGIFPLYPNGPMEVKPGKDKIPQFAGHSTFDDRGRDECVEPKPITSGKILIMAPEDPERYVKIQSLTNELLLFDGRNLAQNGWYVVRGLIPANKTGKVLEWYLKANTIKNWKRTPVIGHSQVGYHPDQEKIAVIELDKNDSPLKSASLFKVTPEGESLEILTADVKVWGNFLRYNYVTFDFTSVKDLGLYIIQYGDLKTKVFPIGTDVYKNVWQQTIDVWFPVQMDHMFVNEAYRVWHGAAHLDDALQAPLNHQHFDGYRMGDSTDTKYKSGERIPDLNVGGWFDAGDYDIRTGSHCGTVESFVETWESFAPKRDETLIDQDTRYVDIHHPDGKIDILQQIEHGTLALVAQHRAFGRAIAGIIVPNLHQYHHLGDGSTMTDNLNYNPALKPFETKGNESGNFDDRWAFTSRISLFNFTSISALAAAHRALKDYNDSLSHECLQHAQKAWNDEQNQEEDTNLPAFFSRFITAVKLDAALQLYISTGDKKYFNQFDSLLWTALDSTLEVNISVAVRALPHSTEEFKNKLRPYVKKYKESLTEIEKQNPYGVLVTTRGWAGMQELIRWGETNYYLSKFYPDIIDKEYTFRTLNYIYGCHPSSNISFVSGVGTHSKKVAYGNNRADFTFIAGGVAPGVLILKPDFPENKEDWPFFWGENEYVIDVCATYIFLANAVNDLLNGTEKQ